MASKPILSKKPTNQDTIPEGIGEFGWDVTNPIPTASVAHNRLYLNALTMPNGNKVQYTRMGSVGAENIPDIIDKYQISCDSILVGYLHLCPYHLKTSEKAPKNLKLSHLGKDILLGVAVADAMGAPVEFFKPTSIDLNEVRSNYASDPDRLTAFGAWYKPVGTFTDDSSMTFCLAEYLAKGKTDLKDLMQLFTMWADSGYWTADGETFDIGNTCSAAIHNFSLSNDPTTCGMASEKDNGNGSLMRILPLLFPFRQTNDKDKYQLVSEFSGLTHAHKISVDCCFIYLWFASLLHDRKDIAVAWNQLLKTLPPHILNDELYANLFKGEITQADASTFNAKGYVLGTLEIAIYCLLTTSSYEDAVVKAISYGNDTDTNAAVTGGLAAIVYGYQTIPQHWLAPLKRVNKVVELAENLELEFENGYVDATFDPIGKYTEEQLIEIVCKLQGKVPSYIDDYKNRDFLDPESDDFHNYWIDIYTHLAFAYGVKYGYIDFDAYSPSFQFLYFGEDFSHPTAKDNYDFDIYGYYRELVPNGDYYILNNLEFYQHENIEAILDFV